MARTRFVMFRAARPTADGCEYVGTITLSTGEVLIVEARVLEKDGRRGFEGKLYPALRDLMRTAKVSGDPKAIPDDLIALMEAPFDDPLPGAPP